VGVLHLLAAGLFQELLESVDNDVDIFLTESNYSAVIEDYIGKEGV